MILIISTGKVNPEKLTPYLEAVRHSGAVEAALREPGCLTYEISADVAMDGTLHITECYDGIPAMQAHLKEEAMAKMTEINKKFGVTYAPKLYKAEPMG